MGYKYLVRDDAGSNQDRVESVHNADPWVTPTGGDWANVGTTHREEDPPGGDVRFDLREDGAFRYGIVAGAWVDRTQAQKDADKLDTSKDRRMKQIVLFQEEIDTLDKAYFTANVVTEIKDRAAARKTACEAARDAHEANWETVWTPGTNP